MLWRPRDNPVEHTNGCHVNHCLSSLCQPASDDKKWWNSIFIPMVSWGFDCYSILIAFLNDEAEMRLWDAECPRCSTVLSTRELSHHLAHWVAAKAELSQYLLSVCWMCLFLFQGIIFSDTGRGRKTPATDQSLTVINTKEQSAFRRQTMTIATLFYFTPASTGWNHIQGWGSGELLGETTWLTQGFWNIVVCPLAWAKLFFGV